MTQLQVVRQDITTMSVDAIVNAANSPLAGGGGVDGAIHRAAGPELVRASVNSPCPTGEARLTPGFGLPAKFVIHTVGPVWHGGDAGEPALLAACYRNCLAVAAREEFRSIAFPAISTGIYGYPVDKAAAVAAAETRAFLRTAPAALDVVYFVCFDRRAFDVFDAALNESEPGRAGPMTR